MEARAGAAQHTFWSGSNPALVSDIEASRRRRSRYTGSLRTAPAFLTIAELNRLYNRRESSLVEVTR